MVIFGNVEAAAKQIDAGTVELEGTPVATILGLPLAIRWDVDQDGRKDLIVLIDDVAGALPTGPQALTVTARLRDGTEIAGTGDVHVDAGSP